MTPGSDPRPASGRSGARAPLRARRLVARREARRRIAARTTQPLTAAQQAFDPLARSRSTTARRAAIAILAIASSIGVHLAVIGGALWSRPSPKAARDQVTVAMREHEREPEKKPPPPPPAPVERPVVRRIAKEPPPPAPPPVAPPKAKPVRVVGLSLESTMGEGGDGPAFAAGNTRLGETAEKAVAPSEISGAPKGDTKAPAASGTGNQVASRIPVAGVRFTLPKVKHRKPPPYPATLKSQAIEGEVYVQVDIDPTGKVLSVKITKGSPYPEFDEAARTAALEEEFEPALRDGVPMPYKLNYVIRFRLEDQ